MFSIQESSPFLFLNLKLSESRMCRMDFARFACSCLSPKTPRREEFDTSAIALNQMSQARIRLDNACSNRSETLSVIEGTRAMLSEVRVLFTSMRKRREVESNV